MYTCGYILYWKKSRRHVSVFCGTGKRKRVFSLIKEERLARPKVLGGWGLKNIHQFRKALAAKSMWRLIKCTGLFLCLIQSSTDKCSMYLRFISCFHHVEIPITSLYKFPSLRIDWHGK
jgi:hypothetical protein